MTPELRTRAIDALRAGLSGDLAPSLALDAHLSQDGTAASRAWSLALRSQRWLADPSRGELPRIDAIANVYARGGGSSDVSAALVLACAHAERACLLSFDARSLRAWLEAHAAITHLDEPWLAVGVSWLHVLEGRSVEPPADLPARAHTEPEALALTLELAALRAGVAVAARELDEATLRARRASRMARTESVPQAEYLANVLLARVRRIASRPHLASRILAALLRVAPSPWRAWLARELYFSAGLAAEADAAIAGAEITRASSVGALLAAAMTGDRGGYADALTRAREEARDFMMLHEDLALLDASLRPSADIAAVPGLAQLMPWARGEVHDAPLGLYGVCSGETGALAYALAGPSISPRRVLQAGLGLASLEAGARVLAPSRRPQLRTEAMIAALALVGRDGMREDDLFRLLYGFEYQAARHRNVKNVLFHRARERAREVGALVREDGWTRLDLTGAWLLPDARCERSSEDAVLAALARWGRASAPEIAERLGLALRTAQEVLKKLADDGACEAEREGRNVHYVLEDTTFSEPTRS